jgi:hypothetical protein
MYPPTSVSLATRVIFLGSFLSAIGGVMAILDGAVGGGVLSLGVATALYMTSQRLALGDRTWWYVALAILGLAVASALLPPGPSWFAVVPGFALACLLSPSARRFYTAPVAPAPEQTVPGA